MRKEGRDVLFRGLFAAQNQALKSTSRPSYKISAFYFTSIITIGNVIAENTVDATTSWVAYSASIFKTPAIRAVVTPLGTAAEITSTCITSCETGPAMSSYDQITSQATNGPAIKRTALPHITSS